MQLCLTKIWAHSYKNIDSSTQTQNKVRLVSTVKVGQLSLGGLGPNDTVRCKIVMATFTNWRAGKFYEHYQEREASDRSGGHRSCPLDV